MEVTAGQVGVGGSEPTGGKCDDTKRTMSDADGPLAVSGTISSSALSVSTNSCWSLSAAVMHQDSSHTLRAADRLQSCYSRSHIRRQTAERLRDVNPETQTPG